MLEGAHVQVASPTRRVGRREVCSAHRADGDALLATGRGIAALRRWNLPAALQRVRGPHGGRLPARSEPRLGEDTGADPTLQLDVVESGAQQAAIERELCLTRQFGDAARAVGIGCDGVAEALHERRVRFPVDVFRWIEGGEPLRGAAASLQPTAWPPRLNSLPSFITKSTCWRTVMFCNGSPCAATMSARLPTAIVPASRSTPSSVAPLAVPATMACIGVIP